MLRYARLPVQDRPLYDFYLGEDGNLHVKTYDRYAVCPQGCNRKRYRMYAGPYHTVVQRSNEQLDRFVYGHYFTFDPDISAAIAAIIHDCNEKIDELSKAIDRARAVIKMAETARSRPIVNDPPEPPV